MIGDFNADDDVAMDDIDLMLLFMTGNYWDFEEIDYYAAGYADDDIDIGIGDIDEILSAYTGTGGARIWYYGDFYYDEVNEIYTVYGDLHE